MQEVNLHRGKHQLLLMFSPLGVTHTAPHRDHNIKKFTVSNNATEVHCSQETIPKNCVLGLHIL